MKINLQPLLRSHKDHEAGQNSETAVDRPVRGDHRDNCGAAPLPQRHARHHLLGPLPRRIQLPHHIPQDQVQFRKIMGMYLERSKESKLRYFLPGQTLECLSDVATYFGPTIFIENCTNSGSG